MGKEQRRLLLPSASHSNSEPRTPYEVAGQLYMTMGTPCLFASNLSCLLDPIGNQGVPSFHAPGHDNSVMSLNGGDQGENSSRIAAKIHLTDTHHEIMVHTIAEHAQPIRMGLLMSIHGVPKAAFSSLVIGDESSTRHVHPQVLSFDALPSHTAKKRPYHSVTRTFADALDH